MKLIHITTRKNIDSIKENGLIASKNYIYTSILGKTLNKFKPDYLPEFLDFSRCIFLVNPQDAYMDFRRNATLHPGLYTEIIEVSTEDLNINKLYSGSIKRIGIINDYLNNINDYIASKSIDDPYLEDNPEDLKTEIKKTSLYKDFISSVNEYWKDFIPFNEYQIKRGKYSDFEKLRHAFEYEIMYFENIPNYKIKQIKIEDILDIWLQESMSRVFENLKKK